METLRCGSTEVDEDDDEEEEESDEEIDADDEEEDDEEEDDEEEVTDDEAYDDEEEEDDDDDDKDAIVEDDEEYDDMIVASPTSQMVTLFGIMLLSKRVDMANPVVVRIARFSFIAYVVVLQLFLLYARMQAKSINDRTPIQITNPISKMLGAVTQGDDSLSQVKDIASSLLKSASTRLEYDLQQIKTMNGGLLVNMGMMWFLHFKMNQVQPLVLQTVQGLQNLYYSPLFQVYILGRNLKRPFANPAISGLMEKAGTAAAGASSSSSGTDAEEEADLTNEDEDSEEEEEEEETETEEDSEEEEEDDDIEEDDDDTEEAADDDDDDDDEED